MFHFIDILKAKIFKTEPTVFDSADFSRAKTFWIRKVQWIYFKDYTRAGYTA